MFALNTTSSFEISHFVLICFPSIQSWQHWLSIPLAFLLVVAIVANITILEVTRREQRLHEPMYYFLSFLAVLDLILCLTNIPKILAILSFNWMAINMNICFLQMYIMNTFLTMQSATFLSMAFDRYMAICKPLYYHSVITTRFVAKVIAFILFRNLLLGLPYPILAARLHYCFRIAVNHCVCTNVAVTSLSCDDRSINKLYQLIVGFSLLGTDFIFICLSYFMIIRVVTKLQTKGAAAKAFSTCTSHLILISFFYTILLVWIFTHKLEKIIPPDVPVMFNVLHLLAPPTLNPVVYSIRTKEIKQGIKRMLRESLTVQ
ncbi:olfactory receptor 56A4-like [Pleurodeles waltl]|uniref:olfactory receptor 56A4-like n=1 Tax=Pleurodeles waltl TaxID=8319 RepID=UPI003709542B